MTECATSARCHLWRCGGLGSLPPPSPVLLWPLLCSCEYLGEEQRSPVRATAWWPSLLLAAELGFPGLASRLPGAVRGKGPERFCVSAGHRPGTQSIPDCWSVRIYVSEQCPGRVRTCAHGSGEDCCARSGLRNVPSGVIPGHARAQPSVRGAEASARWSCGRRPGRAASPRCPWSQSAAVPAAACGRC